ncbi:hypothetical protein BD410DRAFT_513357 [Rickenella mellea]|uniref:Uncharacterized protein n=1 Tax=Rickenella mellea TaxID=50990 RepID=A0A4Y7PSN1_9AGAM|nr:hypothetical protein BD410DRAFT_513357 [Rickenella mellea]
MSSSLSNTIDSADNSKKPISSIPSINNAAIGVVPLGPKSGETAMAKPTTSSEPLIDSSVSSDSTPESSTNICDTVHLDAGTKHPPPQSTTVSQDCSQSTPTGRGVLKTRKLNIPSSTKKSVFASGKLKAKSQKPKFLSAAGRVYSGLPPRLGHIQIAAFHKKLEASKALAKKETSRCSEKVKSATPEPLTRTDRFNAVDLMVFILMHYRGSPGLIKDFFWEIFSRKSLILREQFDEILETESFFVSNVLPPNASRHQAEPLCCFTYDASLDAQHDQRIHRIARFSADSTREATLPTTIDEF